MKDLSIYFQPLDALEATVTATLGEVMTVHTADYFPEIQKGDVVLFYVPEFRNHDERLHGQRDDRFRNHFQQLNWGSNWEFVVKDLGDLLPGETIEDTYFAVQQIVAELVKIQAVPVVIGGGQDLTFAMYRGYEQLEQMINALSIDYRYDLGDPEHELKSDAFVSKLLMHRPCFLFNYAVLGVQAPFVKAEELSLFERLYFDTVRLGEFNADFKIAEPLLRNTDLLSIDLNALRSSEVTNGQTVQPNGFFNHELCQLAKYAGISDKLTSLGIFNLVPEQSDERTHASLAQMIWYFLDGIAMRVGDFPVGTKKNYTKFTVFMDELDHELVFFRSDKSARWWMEVPYPPVEGVRFERHHMVPCNKQDYDHAVQGELPDLWWRTYQKLG